MAEGSRLHMHKDIPTNMHELKTSVYLSDPGALPVLGIVTFALGFCTSFMGWFLYSKGDVQITFGKRQSVLRQE